MVDRPDPAGGEHFTQPVRQIALMLVVLTLVTVGAGLAGDSVQQFFNANIWLNGTIAIVFVVGVAACFWQVIQLISSVNWIEGHVAENPGHELVKAPRLLAPLAQLLRTRGKAMRISSSSSSSILESVATRIDEARDITRYLVSLLIFLGLLGTFYGLAVSVPAILGTIKGLSALENENGLTVFSRLMEGLSGQLDGMGVAFSSSLLGLAGSLVVGLLELFASHGQNRFYRELEEWLSTITRLGYAGDGDSGSDGALVGQMMEVVSDQMERLQALFAESDESRSQVDQRLGTLADSIVAMTQRLDTEKGLSTTLDRVADGQERIVALLEAQAEQGGGALDAESRMRLRSIDVGLLRMLEEISAGRQEATAELRQDLRQLLRAMRQSPGGPQTSAREIGQQVGGGVG